jgi:hypothetical protein
MKKSLIEMSHAGDTPRIHLPAHRARTALAEAAAE